MMDYILYGNSIEKWIYAFGIVVLLSVFLRITRGILSHRLNSLARKTKTDIDDLIVKLVTQIKFYIIVFLSIYFGSLFLTLSDFVNLIIGKILIITLLLQAAIWGSTIVTFGVEKYKKRKMAEDAASVTTFTALGFVIRLILWSVIILLILDNLGIDVTTLVAGLGVGGIAIALAVQNILGDLFASLSIVLDKPFVIGDFIIIDNFMGTVEHIGLKTTRLRSLSGEQLVFANNDLLKSRIRNYKRMYERRVLFSIGVIYQTSYEQLKAIPHMIREIIEAQDKVRFDRAHFKEFGASSLNFEIVYWVQVPDYVVYMDIHQAINLALFKKFEQEGIEFAYPTQTIFLEQESLPGSPPDKKVEKSK